MASWENLRACSGYEIYSEHPYPIRNKLTGKIVSEFDNGNGYIRMKLNGVPYYKHRIIAQQWLENPDDLPCIDHINQNRADNRLENLRYVSYSENNKNKSSTKGYVYTLLAYDDAPEDLIAVDHYNQHELEDYYYSPEENKFYFDTGVNYRELPILFTQSGSAFVNARSVQNNRVHIFFTKFKKLFGFQ